MSYPLIEFPITCFFCDCEEFIPVSTGAGQLIPVCNEHISKFDMFYCELCDRYHPNSRLSDSEVACVEFAQLLESTSDSSIPEWFKEGPPHHWHDDGACWHKDCKPHHYHGHDQPCWDAETCHPCPSCGGRMEPGVYQGLGCSRSCAYDGSIYDGRD